MIPGLNYFRILFILVFLFGALDVAAQPTLPDIAGSAKNGIVILSWVCQYNGIKSITVLRSSDSINNYTVIGHVKKRDKGVEAFVDGHPVAGKNYYKLSIIFSSGLSWSSNHCSLYIDRASLNPSSMGLPENDSLQKFIVTEGITNPGSKDSITKSITNIQNGSLKNSVPAPDSAKEPKRSKKIEPDLQVSKPQPDSLSKKTEPGLKVKVSFEMDSVGIVSGMHASADATLPRKRITVTFEDPGVNSVTFIKSRYIFTDPVSGHVNLDLPDDVKSHHYSLKFYNEHDHVIMEVPKINASKIIIDKRNFQHPGVYKFIILKDVTELERGYIEIKPF